MAGTVVSQQQYGPIRTRIEAQGAALALYQPRVRNTIVRNSLRRGGVFWLGFYLLKRFSSYAKQALGYPAIKKGWAIKKARKTGQVVPFMGLTPVGDPSKMVTAATTGGRSSAIATQTRGEIRITVPFGHPLRPEFAAAFRTIPSGEIIEIAKEVEKALVAELAGNPLNDSNTRKGPKPRVTGATRAPRKTGGGRGRRTR